MLTIKEKTALYIYEKWADDKKNSGFHTPDKCPTVSDNNEENKDIIHCSKCCSELYGFDELDNPEKNEYLEKADQMISSLSKFGLAVTEIK